MILETPKRETKCNEYNENEGERVAVSPKEKEIVLLIR